MLIVVILIVVLWGCSQTERSDFPTSDESINNQELTNEQALAADFLFKLVKYYGGAPYSIKVHDVKIFTDDGVWYFVSADAEVDGSFEGERRRYGNDVVFHIDEEISFTSKEASAYKFLSEDNRASDRGESLELTDIINELSRLIDLQTEVDRSHR